MEYIDGVNIHYYLIKNHDLSTIENIITQVIKALVLLHKTGIIHRDLKPDNIMVDVSKQIVKIIDFGLSINEKTCTKKVGSLLYMAPEMLKKSEYNNKVDLYSFGIMLYRLIENKNIYYEADDPELNRQYHIRRLRKGFENRIKTHTVSTLWKESKFLYSLLENTIKIDPLKRFSALDAQKFLGAN